MRQSKVRTENVLSREICTWRHLEFATSEALSRLALYERKTCHFCLKSPFYIFLEYIYFIYQNLNVFYVVNSMKYPSERLLLFTTRGVGIWTRLRKKVVCCDLTSVLCLSILARKILEACVQFGGKNIFEFRWRKSTAQTTGGPSAK